MTKFFQLLAGGVALGSIYALITLGFVIIYKSTAVINFAQGGFALLGAFLTYNASQTWGLPFYVSILVAVVMMAALGVLVEAVILRRMVGQPVFAVIMVTIGLLFVIEPIAETIWGVDPLGLDDPWGGIVRLGDVTIAKVDVWTVGVTLAALLAFFLFFRFSSMGVAMRATASDQEAALAQGISARRVFGLSWAIAGALAVLGGVLLGADQSVSLPIGFIALRAFPAMILGGLDSPTGAVVGGVIIGVTEVLTAGYITTDYAHIVGNNFHHVMPYLVMVLILLVRPYGLFGTPEVRRV